MTYDIIDSRIVENNCKFHREIQPTNFPNIEESRKVKHPLPKTRTDSRQKDHADLLSNKRSKKADRLDKESRNLRHRTQNYRKQQSNFAAKPVFTLGRCGRRHEKKEQ